MITPRRRAGHLSPSRAVPGGRFTVRAGPEPFPVDPLPSIHVGGVPARVVAVSPSALSAIVPPDLDGGWLPVALAGEELPLGFIEIGARMATGLHQVDSPVFDADGNLYVTYSGTRGQRVPVSVFRVRPDGARESLAAGIVNATSVAFDPDGGLCVTSRFDGAVYRVKPGGTLERVAAELGVACGLAFGPDGSMFVGDRSGTLFRVNAAGRVIPFATLPPSVAAFHLAVGPDEAVYVSAPTLSTRDVIYRVDRRSEVSVFATGFGRPQGIAFDAAGSLYVAEALAGASGIYRVPPRGPRELMVAGAGLIGLAFHRRRGVAVVSHDTAYRFDAW
jgi:streptogramin lyase